jgi:hypothetical protein
MLTAGVRAVARPAAISGPTTKTSSSWIASNAYALSSVSSGTSSAHRERIDGEIGGIVAPWIAISATRRTTAAPDRIATVTRTSATAQTAPVERITRRRPIRSTSRPTKPAVTPMARPSAPTTAPISP